MNFSNEIDEKKFSSLIEYLSEKIGFSKTVKQLIERRQRYLNILLIAKGHCYSDLQEITGYDEKRLDTVYKHWKWSTGDMVAISLFLELTAVETIELFSHDIPRFEKLIGKKIGHLTIMGMSRDNGGEYDEYCDEEVI